MFTILFWSIIILLVLPKGVSILCFKLVNNKVVKKSAGGQIIKAALNNISLPKTRLTVKSVCKKILKAYD